MLTMTRSLENGAIHLDDDILILKLKMLFLVLMILHLFTITIMTSGKYDHQEYQTFFPNFLFLFLKPVVGTIKRYPSK